MFILICGKEIIGVRGHAIWHIVLSHSKVEKFHHC